MKEQSDQSWIPQMADLLVLEVLEQMCGIRAESCDGIQQADEAMDAVYGAVDGEYRMQLRFRAHPRMFGRMAENMMGKPPQEEDIRDHAEEFFNVLCGRFVSEAYRSTKKKGRFLPTRYKAPLQGQEEQGDCFSHVRYYMSEEKEPAEFSWSFANAKKDEKVLK